MFEQSMVVSQHSHLSTGARWTWAGSLTLQCCAAALLIAVPLLHPERLALTSPPSPPPFLTLEITKPVPVKVRLTPAEASTPQPLTSPMSASLAMTVPARIPQQILAGDPPPVSATGALIGMGAKLPGALAASLPQPRISMTTGSAAPSRGPVRLSSGVAAGLLISPIRPSYPGIARAARVEGAVVVEAVISREGRIERAHVLQGPAMLTEAALTAIEAARYTPFHLNGIAVDVETTITVNFKLGG